MPENNTKDFDKMQIKQKIEKRIMKYESGEILCYLSVPEYVNPYVRSRLIQIEHFIDIYIRH